MTSISPSSIRQPKNLVALLLWLLFINLAVAWLQGCATAPAYRTLYSVGHGTDAAVRAYFDGVVTGAIRTNGVPAVARKYDAFQSAYRAALALAEFNPTVPVTSNVAAAASAVLKEINAEKGSQ